MPIRVVRHLIHSAQQARLQMSRAVLPQNRGVGPDAHQHLCSSGRERSLCWCVSLQSVHNTRMFNIVSPEQRNTMMLPLSATCPTDTIDLCKPVVFGADLEIVRHADSVTCAHEVQCATRRGESWSNGRPEFHPSSTGFASQAVRRTLSTHCCCCSRGRSGMRFAIRHGEQPFRGVDRRDAIVRL